MPSEANRVDAQKTERDRVQVAQANVNSREAGKLGRDRLVGRIESLKAAGLHTAARKLQSELDRMNADR
ncbi:MULTISPECIES: hypothetical protein [unclassified Ruegeria]|uniref:hypothetical protein n=1 Tax=unclassified Ruegeria TaxID=2625375 RepID=UPI001490919F|nr:MULTISPECIES: hypothetical protein [unclassified Ruegeria]NOD87893.1 hypothetical protein [Ruegeria sp. HKCCD4318]NOE14263.1 hypothetical protein [Ruegeria sp. HKCCD4318-2]NOG08380.1 hypothetical protein [Ruegeria sp. HKCCD4315]